jgi:hypothetical protein
MKNVFLSMASFILWSFICIVTGEEKQGLTFSDEEARKRLQQQAEFMGVEENLFDAVFRLAEDPEGRPKIIVITDNPSIEGMLRETKVTISSKKTGEQVVSLACSLTKLKCRAGMNAEGECEMTFFSMKNNN